jgi:hypothetical protein
MSFLEDKANGRTPDKLFMSAKEAEYLIDALADFRK